MAYGEKYYGLMASLDGARYRVSVMEEAYAGAAEELTLTDEAAQISWGRRGADLYTPVLASHATARFWKLAPGVLEDLYGAPPGRFRLEISEEGGDLYWTGSVLGDVYEDSTMNRPEAITLQAVDGLGQLKEIPYAPRASLAYTTDENRVSFAEALGNILSSLHPEDASARLPFTVAARWRPYQMDEAKAPGGLYDGLRFDQQVFYDPEEEAWASCYTVLRQLLYVTGAGVYQQGGRWHVVQRTLLAEGGVDARHVFNPDGTYTGATEPVEAPREVVLGHPAPTGSAVVARLQGKRTFREARAKTSLTYAHGPLPDLIPGGTFGFGPSEEVLAEYYREGLFFDMTTYEGPWNLQSALGASPVSAAIVTREPALQVSSGPGYIAGIERNEKYNPDRVLWLGAGSHADGASYAEARRFVVENEASGYVDTNHYVSEGQVVAFRGECFVERAEGGGRELFQTYWRLRVGDYWLRADGTWEAGADWARALRSLDGVQYFVPPADENSSYGKTEGFALETWNTLTVVAAPHPAGGHVFCQLWGSSDGGGEQDTGPARWDNVSLAVVNLEGKAVSSTRTTVSTGQPEPAKDEVEIFIGEGPAEGSLWGNASRLTVLGETAPASGGGTVHLEEAATDWKREPYSGVEAPSSTTLQELIAGTWLRAQTKPLMVRHETYRALFYEMGRALQVGGRPFAPVYVKKNLYHGTDEVELVELAFSEGALTVGAVGKEDGIFVPTGGGGESLERQRLLETSARAAGALAGYLAAHNPLTVTSAEVPAGDISSLPVEQRAGSALRAGDALVVVRADTGEPLLTRCAADEPVEGFAAVPVEDALAAGAPYALEEVLPAGSGVYWASRELVLAARAVEAEQDQQRIEIDDAAVERAAHATTLDDHETRITTLEEDGGGSGAWIYGEATIEDGNLTATVDPALEPGIEIIHVGLTPQGVPEHLWGADVGEQSFDVQLAQPATRDNIFRWWAATRTGVVSLRILFYIETNGDLRRVDLDAGTNEIIPTASLEYCLRVDLGAGYIFASDGVDFPDPYRYGLDGSNPTNMRQEGTWTTGLDIDRENQWLYYTDTFGAIWRVGYDQSGHTNIVSFDRNSDGRPGFNTEIDKAAGLLFYATGSELDSLQRTNLDGSGERQILLSGYRPAYFALDRTAQQIYYAKHPGDGSTEVWAVGYDGQDLGLQWTHPKVIQDMRIYPETPALLHFADESGFRSCKVDGSQKVNIYDAVGISKFDWRES